MRKGKCSTIKIVSQLHRIEGQVRAIEKMHADQRDIKEIIRVVQAARASLDSVTRLLVANKVNGCYNTGSAVQKNELIKLIDVLFKIT